MKSVASKAEANRLAKIYYAENAPAIREQRAAWRLANKDRVAAWNAKQIAKPGAREAARQATRNWRIANPGAADAANRIWREANPEAFKRSRDQWLAANPEAARLIKMNRRARLRGADAVPFTAEQATARVAYYGGRCWMCGGAYEQLDHVKPLSKGGPHMLSNLRPSCADCNVRKNGLWFGLSELHQFIKN